MTALKAEPDELTQHPYCKHTLHHKFFMGQEDCKYCCNVSEIPGQVNFKEQQLTLAGGTGMEIYTAAELSRGGIWFTSVKQRQRNIFHDLRHTADPISWPPTAECSFRQWKCQDPGMCWAIVLCSLTPLVSVTVPPASLWESCTGVGCEATICQGRGIGVCVCVGKVGRMGTRGESWMSKRILVKEGGGTSVQEEVDLAAMVDTRWSLLLKPPHPFPLFSHMPPKKGGIYSRRPIGWPVSLLGGRYKVLLHRLSNNRPTIEHNECLFGTP